MGTKINYVDETWNPVVGCTKCSPGCDNCYAEKMAARLAAMECANIKEFATPTKRQRRYVDVVKLWHDPKIQKTYFKGWNGKVYCDEKALDKPLHWRQPRRILVPSMGDLFHEKVPFEFIHEVWDTMKKCPQHTFLVLTKRVERMSEIVGRIYKLEALGHAKGFWNHIHLGVTICNQEEADEKIPIGLQIPGFDWISIEPMLGEINLEYIKDYTHPNQFSSYDRIYSLSGEKSILGHKMSCNKIDWVVVGCEKIGQKPGRECKPEWIKSIVDQCKAAGTKCFVKQMEVNGKVVHDLAKMPAWAVQEL